MNMIGNFKDYLLNFRDRQRIAIALSKGTAMMLARRIDLTRPETWEFSGFSQNGEDGIIEVLRKQLRASNRYFIEIGVEDGIECNSAWLLIAEKYGGIMIEGNQHFAERAKWIVLRYSNVAECYHMFMTKESVQRLKSLALHFDPDVFSLDIDGNDYYIVKEVLDAGFRPKIVVVEYNSVFGPKRSMTIPYRQDFVHKKAHPTELCYGVSISAWRKVFVDYGYRFVTVDQHGINAFFVDPACFDSTFLKRLKGNVFAENQYQLTKFRKPSEEQFKLIADQEFISF